MSFYNFNIYPLSEEKFSLKGDNNKKVIIIHKASEKTVCEETLPKILGALNFKFPEDILLLSLEEKDTVNLTRILATYEIEKVIIFAIKPSDLGLHIEVPFYNILDWNDCKYLFVDELEVIMKDKSLKTKLWQHLQPMLTA